MPSSNAKVIPADARDATSADATDVGSAKTAHVASTEAADVATAEAADVTAAKATHVTSAKAATTVSATTATAGLRIGGKKAAGKHRACQYHHHSSSHDILHWDGRTFRHRTFVRCRRVSARPCRRRDGLEMGVLIDRLY
jgi:hypothetical protein